jgi:hypothetical protein
MNVIITRTKREPLDIRPPKFGDKSTATHVIPAELFFRWRKAQQEYDAVEKEIESIMAQDN